MWLRSEFWFVCALAQDTAVQLSVRCLTRVGLPIGTELGLRGENIRASIAIFGRIRFRQPLQLRRYDIDEIDQNPQLQQ